MIALPGMRGGLHLAQQGIHFFCIQPPASAHRPAAGHISHHLFEPFSQGQSGLIFGKIVSEIADQAGNIHLSEQGRRGAHANRAQPEGLNFKTKLGELIGPGQDARRLILAKLDHIRDQQGLPF